MFKIKRDGTSNRYIIRSMLNNRMTMTTAGTYGTDIITEELTAYDSSVSTADMFYINYDATIGTYTIEPCSDPGYVIAAIQTTASGMDRAPNSFLTLVSKNSTSYTPDWFLHRYTGEDQAGGMANYNNPFIAGSTGRVTVYAWSTVIGANEQHLYIGSDQADIATGTWSESDYKLYVSPHDEGDFRVFIDVRKNGVNVHRFAIDLRVELPFQEGNYIFKNKSTQYAMAPDNNNQHFMEQYVASDSNRQKWIVIHEIDAYYQIRNLDTGLYLTAPESSDTGTKILEEDFSTSDRQLWKFYEASGGAYKIQSKSREGTDIVISLGLTSGSGANILQMSYEDDSNYKDEWIVQSSKDKAIVILPGMLGSSLETTSGTDVWLNIFNYSKLELNEDGTSTHSIRSINNDNYGAANTYKTLYNELYQAYNNSFDILFFDYDFRLTNDLAAEKLETEVGGYNEIILVAHSMGGLVASKFLSNSLANRAKTTALITIGTPFFGAAKCIDVMETGDMIVLDKTDLIDLNPTLFTNTIKNVSKNSYSAYQLLPTDEYYNITNLYPLSVNGVYYSSVYDPLKNTAWGKCNNGQTKAMFDAAENFHNSLYNNSNYVINFNDVKTYTLAGMGEQTIATVHLDSNYNVVDLTTTSGGDGTVLQLSAGYGVADYWYMGTDHTGLVSSTVVISRVIRLIEDETNVEPDSTPNTANDSVYETDNTAITLNARGWIEGIDNRRINIYADTDDTLYYNGEKIIEYNDYVFDSNGNRLGNVWKLGSTGNKMYVLYDGEYSIVGNGIKKIVYMDGGYYKKVIEYAPSAQTMSVSIGNASSMHVSVVQSGINLESIGFTYSESKLHELNLD